MIEQVSRNGNLKIPKKINVVLKNINSIEDKWQITKAIKIAKNQRMNEKRIKDSLKKEDQEIELISKIPYNSNDLIVITVVKKLSAYIITITEKSPKKFRGVFVNRMQNYCLDTLELLLNANFTRLDSEINKSKRGEFQKEAIIKLKLLGYISMVAEASNCILKKTI